MKMITHLLLPNQTARSSLLSATTEKTGFMKMVPMLDIKSIRPALTNSNLPSPSSRAVEKLLKTVSNSFLRPSQF